MLTEEIARLTGRLVFSVDNRPLIAFEKRLEKVTGMLRQFSDAVNKKFQIKVSLDSRTLRAQLEKAANAKVSFQNFSIDQEALNVIQTKMSEKLGNTPIRLKNVKIDVAELVAQKKFLRTSMSQMQVNLETKIVGKEGELRKWVKDVEERLKIKLRVELVQAQFDAAVRKAIRHASTTAGAVSIKVADPKIKLMVDKDDLQRQIASAISQRTFDVRVKVNGQDKAPTSTQTTRHAAVGGAAGAGLATATMGFARGALPGLGAAWALGQINQINQELQASQNALQAVSKTSEEFDSNMKFLEQITEEQGRNMRDVAPAFTSVLASAGQSIGAEGTQDVFRGVMKYGTVMGLDQEAMKGTFRAIGQMFSKDKIQAEEAQGQLAERLPAAMQLLAEANQMTVPQLREAMQKGALDPKKIIPEMARIMEELADSNGNYTRALESTRVQQGRMNRQFERTVKVFSEAGFDRGMGKFFKNTADAMREAEPLVKALGGAFEALVAPVNAVLNVVVSLGNFLAEKVAPALGMTSEQLFTLLGVVGSLIFPWTRLATVIGLVALAVEDLIGFSQGKDSLFGRWLEGTPEAQKAFDDLKKSAEEFGGYVSKAWEALKELSGGLKGLSFSEMFISTMKELNAILESINNVIRRFVAAGQWAQATGGDNKVEQNLRNLQGFFKGPEWVEQQMKLLQPMTAQQAAPDTKPQGKTAANEDAAAWGEVLAQTLREQAQAQALQMNVPVTITGVQDKDEMAKFFERRMKEAAESTIYDWFAAARARQKDIK